MRVLLGHTGDGKGGDNKRGDDGSWTPLRIQHGDDDGLIKQVISNWAPLNGTGSFALLAQINRFSEKIDPSYALEILVSTSKTARGHKLSVEPYLLPLRFDLKDILVIMRAFDKEYEADSLFDPLRLIFAQKIHTESGKVMHHTEIAEQSGSASSYRDLSGLSWPGIVLSLIKEIEIFEDFDDRTKERHRLTLSRFFKPQKSGILNDERPSPPLC